MVTKLGASEVVLASRQEGVPGWAPGGTSPESKGRRLEARRPPKRAVAAVAMQMGQGGEVDRKSRRELTRVTCGWTLSTD